MKPPTDRTPSRSRHLALVLSVLLLSSCALLRRPEEPIDHTQDPRIQREVMERLAREPALESGQIRVEVEGRRVILRGSVPGIAAWQCAIRTAELVQGVQGVVDFLVLERGPREVQCLAPRSTDPGS